MIILSAILPVFITIIAGFLIRKYFITDENFWAQTDRLVFFVLIPLMLIEALMTAPFNSKMVLFGVTVFGMITFICALTYLLKPVLGTDNRGFTSVVQGAVRVNFFISLSIAGLLYGDEGIKILSFALLFMVTSGVTYSILTLQRYGCPETQSAKKKQKAYVTLAKNPVVLSTFLGLILGILVDEVPMLIDQTLSIFGRAALPLALLSVGASLKIEGMLNQKRPLIISTLIGLIFSPLLGIIVASAVGLSLIHIVCCILILGVPAAASAITFAAKMGGDKELMSSILTLQTGLSLISLPVFIAIAPYIQSFF